MSNFSKKYPKLAAAFNGIAHKRPILGNGLAGKAVAVAFWGSGIVGTIATGGLALPAAAVFFGSAGLLISDGVAGAYKGYQDGKKNNPPKPQ